MRENRTHGSEGGEAQSLPYPYRLEPATISAPKTWVAGPSQTKSGHGDPLWLRRIVACNRIGFPGQPCARGERAGVGGIAGEIRPVKHVALSYEDSNSTPMLSPPCAGRVCTYIAA